MTLTLIHARQRYLLCNLLNAFQIFLRARKKQWAAKRQRRQQRHRATRVRVVGLRLANMQLADRTSTSLSTSQNLSVVCKISEWTWVITNVS